jgi:hypothetical protein
MVLLGVASLASAAARSHAVGRGFALLAVLLAAAGTARGGLSIHMRALTAAEDRNGSRPRASTTSARC